MQFIDSGHPQNTGDQWYKRLCEECSATKRCLKEWDFPPKYCKDCKASFQRAKKRREEAALLCVRRQGYIAYSDRVKVRKGKDGRIDIYYGGILKADGLGHGHIVVSGDGEIEFVRQPIRDDEWRRFGRKFL